MGLFDKLFGGNNEEGEAASNEPNGAAVWISLTDQTQLETIEQASGERTQILFKHSTRCGISRMALNLFERDKLEQLATADVYFLDLLKYRGISDAIAERFGVPHQSPQLLVIRNGQVVTHASHGGIADVPLENYL